MVNCWEEMDVNRDKYCCIFFLDFIDDKVCIIMFFVVRFVFWVVDVENGFWWWRDVVMGMVWVLFGSCWMVWWVFVWRVMVVVESILEKCVYENVLYVLWIGGLMLDLWCGRNELGYVWREDGRKRRKRRMSVGGLVVEEEEGGRRRKVCWKKENLWRGSCSNWVWLLCVKGGIIWNLVVVFKL